MSTPGISRRLIVAALATICGPGAMTSRAQPQAAFIPGTPAIAAQPPVHLTIEDARHRAVSNNKLLKLAALNVQSKGHATGAAKADYFPKISGNTVFLHFSDALGTVFTTPGLSRLGVAPRTVPVNVLNQNSSFTSVVGVQPITDLLKVREGVKIAKTDEKIAHAQMEKGARELLSGVDQLFWGLLAALKIRSGLQESYQGAEQLAKLGSLEGRTAFLETKQGLQQVDAQVADLSEQLNMLLDFPPLTPLNLIEPPMPGLPVACADDAIRLALAASPDLREAAQNIAKAQAATKAARLDFVPSFAGMGGYTNQTGAPVIQQNFGYIGVVGTYTFIDWGKRKNIVREREHLISMATLKLRQTQDDVAEKARKAYRNVSEGQEAMAMARDLVGLRKEAEAKAFASARTNPLGLLDASKARATAEVDFVKTELAFRQAHVELATLIGL